MGLTLPEAERRIEGILGSYRAALSEPGQGILPPKIEAGKVYEAWVLCRVLERLKAHEGYTPELIGASDVRLKTAPSAINPQYAHFRLTSPSKPPLEVWTDIEFLSLSATLRGVDGQRAERCDYHELDVLVVPAGAPGRPPAQSVRIGVECKQVITYRKELLRAILGVRRELSLYEQPPNRTGFREWPAREVNANPPSCLLAYSTDERIRDFQPPGEVFSVDFIHEPLP